MFFVILQSDAHSRLMLLSYSLTTRTASGHCPRETTISAPAGDWLRAASAIAVRVSIEEMFLLRGRRKRDELAI
jgi:hypothetical protein